MMTSLFARPVAYRLIKHDTENARDDKWVAAGAFLHSGGQAAMPAHPTRNPEAAHATCSETNRSPKEKR